VSRASHRHAAAYSIARRERGRGLRPDDAYVAQVGSSAPLMDWLRRHDPVTAVRVEKRLRELRDA